MVSRRWIWDLCGGLGAPTCVVIALRWWCSKFHLSIAADKSADSDVAALVSPVRFGSTPSGRDHGVVRSGEVFRGWRATACREEVPALVDECLSSLTLRRVQSGLPVYLFGVRGYREQDSLMPTATTYAVNQPRSQLAQSNSALRSQPNKGSTG